MLTVLALCTVAFLPMSVLVIFAACCYETSIIYLGNCANFDLTGTVFIGDVEMEYIKINYNDKYIEVRPKKLDIKSSMATGLEFFKIEGASNDTILH
jgi:hypothetical protein